MTRSATPDIMGAVLAGNDQPLASSLRIADIRRDGGTQPRAGLDDAHVNDLVAALAAGETLPPVDVMYDGAAYWLYDGYHRVEATSRAGRYTVQAVIHQGTQADAQWASYGANPAHGLKRSNEDKRRAVLAALRHPNAVGLSNVQIAAHVHVDEGTIRNYRSQMESTSEIPKSTSRTGADGRTINTANIGANQPVYAPVWKLESEVREVSAQFYDADDQRHAVSDMRAAAKVATGGFWDRCKTAIDATPDITWWRVSDLRQAINNVAAQMEAQANGTNAQASTGSRTDLASRQAAAVDAERQAQAATEPAPVAEVLEIQWLRSETATTNQPAATALADLPVVATTSTDARRRYHVVAGNLRAAMQLLAAAMEAVRGQDDAMRSSIDGISSHLAQLAASAQVAATCVERGEPQTEPPAAAPEPEPPAAPTELPAELVAAGWKLTTMRGKHYASVMVPSEPEPIRTIGRGDVAATIRDAEYMHRNLRIGVTA